MAWLDLDAEPQVIQLDFVYMVERGLEDLDEDVKFDLDNDNSYPSRIAPRTYEKIEEALKKEGIDIDELNKKINKAMFGDEGCIKYYPYKEI